MKKTVKSIKKAGPKTAGKAARKPKAAKTAAKAKPPAVTKKKAAVSASGPGRKQAARPVKTLKGVSRQSPGGAARGNPLLAELTRAATGLSENDIRQLIRQAEILKHNARVLKEHEERKAMAGEAVRQGVTPANKTDIDVKEADDGSSFIIIINNARNFFSLDEMRKLVAICHGADGEGEGARRLYGWFSQHRKDVLIDTKISSPVDQALVTMYRFIKGRYALKRD